MAYEPKTGQLYAASSEALEWLALFPFDPATGELGTQVERLYGNGSGGSGYALFGSDGFPWTYFLVDNTWTLSELTGFGPDPKIICNVQMSFPAPDSVPSPIYTPYYPSFSFDPYTNVLFALAIPTQTFQVDPTDVEENLDLSHFMLCMVNLQTGQPAKVIATYDTPKDSNGAYYLPVIAWGFAPPE